MKFRYFILEGKAKELYVASEIKEMNQEQNVAEVLLHQRDDIESYRPSRSGGIESIVFKAGKQPEGMIRVSKDLPKNEVRPHGKKKEMAPFREFLESLRVTEDCQQTIIDFLKLPQMVIGRSASSRTGMAMFSSRAGHVGDNVIVEIPVQEENSEHSNHNTAYAGHEDLKEIQNWEYVKMHEDFKDYKYGTVYFLGMRG